MTKIFTYAMTTHTGKGAWQKLIFQLLAAIFDDNFNYNLFKLIKIFIQ